MEVVLALLNEPALMLMACVCQILRLLRVLGEGSPEASDAMSDTLAQVLFLSPHTIFIACFGIFRCMRSSPQAAAGQPLRSLQLSMIS